MDTKEFVFVSKVLAICQIWDYLISGLYPQNIIHLNVLSLPKMPWSVKVTSLYAPNSCVHVISYYNNTWSFLIKAKSVFLSPVSVFPRPGLIPRRPPTQAQLTLAPSYWKPGPQITVCSKCCLHGHGVWHLTYAFNWCQWQNVVLLSTRDVCHWHLGDSTLVTILLSSSP